VKIKIKMFKEKRLIFEQGEGAVESSEGEKLPVGSYVNPDGSKYDAETNSYTNAHGDSVSLSPEDAEDRMAEGAIFVEAESSAVEVEATREEAGVIVEAETGHELDKVKAKLETVKGLKEIQAAMGKEFEKVAEILRGKVLRGKIEAGKLREGFVFLGGQEAFEGAVERLGESDMKALRDVLSKSFGVWFVSTICLYFFLRILFNPNALNILMVIVKEQLCFSTNLIFFMALCVNCGPAIRYILVVPGV